MKFPVWQTSLDVFKFMWRERKTAIRFSSVPLGIYLLLTIIVQLIFGATALTPSADPANPFTAPLVILTLVQIVLFLPVTVTWYRFVVLGPVEAQRRPIFTLGRLEGRFMLWQLAILLVFLVIMGFGALFISLVSSLGEHYSVFGPISVVLGVAFAVLIVFAATRLSMVMVLVSLDQPVSLKASWAMTEGITLRLLAAMLLAVLGIILLSLPVGIVIGIVSGILGAMSAAAASTFLTFAAQSIAGLVGILAMVTLFGLVYLKLMDHAAARTSASVTPS
jgi:hypothetical protein